ncbi:MAG: DUF262 domain-containing protein [Verrucomicrobia bacterium]|nr:DUF262 domain-containing protein [Verrucomicrobiota bacterium]
MKSTVRASGLLLEDHAARERTRSMNGVSVALTSIRGLLEHAEYYSECYQRGYRWQEKQVGEMIGDLTQAFLSDYDSEHPRDEVRKYGGYFLGSIILSQHGSATGCCIVDGQQRITSLTLLLMLLRKLQCNLPAQSRVFIDELIVSTRFGTPSLNLNIEGRAECMMALFEDKTFDTTGKDESLHNIVACYRDIERKLPEEINNSALPYFTDWLIEKVCFVRITITSEADVATMFETINARGLHLTDAEGIHAVKAMK